MIGCVGVAYDRPHRMLSAGVHIAIVLLTLLSTLSMSSKKEFKAGSIQFIRLYNFCLMAITRLQSIAFPLKQIGSQ